MKFSTKNKQTNSATLLKNIRTWSLRLGAWVKPLSEANVPITKDRLGQWKVHLFFMASRKRERKNPKAEKFSPFIDIWDKSRVHCSA